MIDLKQDKLIRLREVPALPWLPTRRGGGRLSLSTVYDWATKGTRGVKLETLRVGDCLCTTEPALLRFFERLSQPAPSQAAVTPTERKKAQDRASAILDRMGI